MTLRLGSRPGITIAGSATAFPSDLGAGAALSNADVLRAMLGADTDATLAQRGWTIDTPRERWGVDRREWIRDPSRPGSGVGADVADLAVEAGRRALTEGGSSAGEVDLLLVATSTPARISSILAATVGKRLGVTAACIDVRAGGAGGLSAWLTATRFLDGDCRLALIVAAETPSLYLHPDDLGSALLYGDGAAALVLRHDEGRRSGLVAGFLGRVDAPGVPFTIPGPLPPDAGAMAEGRYHFQRPDRTYLAALADAWSTVCKEVRDTGERIDYAVPYAITAGQVRDVSEGLLVDGASTFETLARDGCLGCAGPLAGLDLLRRSGADTADRLAAFVAVAGGVSTSAIVWRL